MSWTYDYKVGPPGGALVSILDYATQVRILAEWSDGLRGNDPMPQYRHGEESSPRKFHPAATFAIECTLRETNSVGVVTHVDGSAGHVFENFGTLKSMFAGQQNSLIRLERDAPDSGISYLDCWQIDTARPTQNRQTYSWPMKAPHPFCTGTADNGNSGATLTPGGDAPIDDMIIDFASGTDPRITHDTTGDYVEIAGAVPAGGVRVDVGAGTCVRITGGTDYANNLRVNTPWWLELDPGANPITMSAGITVDWFDKWR